MYPATAGPATGADLEGDESVRQAVNVEEGSMVDNEGYDRQRDSVTVLGGAD
jgi:hypothetical protein